jgi:hypothetical protein
MTGPILRLVFTLAASVLLAAGGIVPASAQQAQSGPPSLSLAPAVVLVRGKFGQTVTETISLNNGTQQGLAYDMTAEDVVVRNGKRTFVPPGEVAGSIAASAVFSRRSGYVSPMSQASVQVLLTIPAHTAVRGVVIYFHNKHVIAAHGAVTLNASLGALITFVLTDDFGLQAQTVTVHPTTASENLKVVDVLTNTGSEPVFPEGVAAFVDASGALAAKIPFQAQRLMPGERAAMSGEYSGRLKPGRYRVICTFSYAGRALTATSEFTQR